MKKGMVLFFAVCLAVGSLLPSQDGWTKTLSGSFKIERFWEETVGDFTCTYTIISYKNTTQRTFDKNVTFRASIYDAGKNMIDTNTRSFFAHEYGPIKPGFEGTIKIPIECRPGQSKTVSVRIDNAN